MAGITMDGKTYRVRVVYPSVEESARLVEGPNAGDMLSGRRERDLVGTYYDHTLSVEPAPRYPQDYDQHVANGVIAGVRRWNGLQVSFEGIRPVRLPGEGAV